MSNIYPKYIEEYILKRKKYIPRQLYYNEPLRLYKRYFSIFSGEFFKVDRVYTVEENEYYTIRFEDLLIAEISYPTNNIYLFEMMVDKNGIEKIDDIINNHKSYSGAEIKYWFFIHNIELDSDKYAGFSSYLFGESNSTISDNKYYFVKGDLCKDGIYRDCRMALDRVKTEKSLRQRKTR